MTPTTFLPRDRVRQGSRAGRVFRVRSDGQVDVVFDGQDFPTTRIDPYTLEHEQSSRLDRCPVCGGLNPGDVTHTRC